MDTRKLNKTLKDCQTPYVIIAIGPPLSGKSTLFKSLEHDAVIISRDQILMDLHGSNNYDDAFKNTDQKEVDRILTSTIQENAKKGSNVIIDMTNMTRKRRVHNLSFFGKEYYKIALIFPILEDSEYEKRNLKRKQEEMKYIPNHVLKSMISSYQTVSKEEGFDKIISL